MSLEKIGEGCAKNRKLQGLLKVEQDSLERQRKRDERNSYIDMKKFKNKHSKFSMQFENNVKCCSDVVMYDTHFPGFCYKRNGEYRGPAVSISPPKMDFKEMRDLFFTNGELDAEKVICLHLLVNHKFERVASCLRQVPPNQRNWTPIKRLFTRPRVKRSKGTHLHRVLPTYILDVDSTTDFSAKTPSEISLISDQSLSTSVYVNESLLTLLETVFAALVKCDSDKVNQLYKLAFDKDALKQTLDKSHVQDYLDSLTHHKLITNSESFSLVQPRRGQFFPLPMHTAKGGLENLVKAIRNNILKSPNMWPKRLQRNHQNPVASNSLECEKPRRNSVSMNKGAFTKTNSTAGGLRRSRTNNTGVGEEKFIRSSNLYDKEFKANKWGSDELLIMDDSFEDLHVTPHGLAEIIRQKVETAHQKDLLTTRYRVYSLPKDLKERDEQNRKRGLYRAQFSTSGLKKTNCDACLGKWKQPLPLPKTPVTKRNCIPTLNGETYKEIATDSSHKISRIIDTEYHKLKPKQDSKSSCFSSNRSLGDNARDRLIKKYQNGPIQFDEIDLEKLTLEIVKKETEKKLSNFVQEHK